jgi:hypothetical protein
VRLKTGDAAEIVGFKHPQTHKQEPQIIESVRSQGDLGWRAWDVALHDNYGHKKILSGHCPDVIMR